MSTATEPMRRGVARFHEYTDRIRGILGMLEKSPNPNPIQLGMLKLLLANEQRILDCAENGKPLASIWYGNAPEIFPAMGIQPFCPFDDLKVHLELTDYKDLKDADKHPLPADVCSLIRMAAYAVDEGLVPTPTAMVAMATPCDAQLVLHELWSNNSAWSKVPSFVLDPIYTNTPEDYKYFAGEIKRMVKFLEEHTGQKLDLDKLREVVKESNLQYEVWNEINECRRAVPCPHPSFLSSDIGWGVTEHFVSGDPAGTKLLQMILADAEQKVKEKKGPLPKEKIRILWADLIPTFTEQLGSMLAEEWGAVVVQDFQGFTSHFEPIDTATEESMFLGIAKRSMNSAMIRQGRGHVDVLINDLTRLVKDFKIDCVFFPGHMGHKDQSAAVRFIRETCRNLKVPLLAWTSSNFDPRYMPMDQLKKKISEFFEATGLGKQ